MGAADAVPGVSGGTVALILGIYERFIGALHTATRLPKLVRSAEGRSALKAAFALLIPLGIGVITSYLVATWFLVGPKDNPDGWLRRMDTAPLCYGFFFGLVLASIREPWRRVRNHTPGIYMALLCAAAGAFFLTGLPYLKEEPATWALLPGGAGAISVMLLPGISGSLLLLILNQYQAVASAVHSRDFIKVGIFAAGIVAGIVLFVPFLKWLLNRYHDLTMAALTGLMIGSLRALWPWKSQYDPKVGPMENVEPFGDLIPVILVALVGFSLIIGLGLVERRLKKPQT